MRWHKTQRSKNTLFSSQANVPDSMWLPLTARRCFLARQDQLRGTLVLTSTLGSIRAQLERRRAAAFRTWTRFRPVWFRAGVPLRVRRVLFQALVVSILFSGLEALRLRHPDYEYLDRFVLGLGRKMTRGKATAQKKSAQSTEGRCGISLAWYRLSPNFTLVAFNGTRTL